MARDRHLLPRPGWAAVDPRFVPSKAELVAGAAVAACWRRQRISVVRSAFRPSVLAYYAIANAPLDSWG